MAKKDNKETREQRVARICASINKGSFGGENHDAVTYLSSDDTLGNVERFSSGCPELDDALGGGWAKGRFLEAYGPESGGKTTLALHAVAEHQKKYPDEDCALVDSEFAFDEEYAKIIGVDTRLLIVHQPEHGVQALNVLEQLIQAGVGLTVVDSVAALTTLEEISGDIGDATMGTQARMMSAALRRLTGEAGRRKATVFWTNQLREKIGVMFGDKTTTPAGRALRHYASQRVFVVRIGMVRETKEGPIVSAKTKAEVKKNKTAPPFKKAEFNITFGIGIDLVASILDTAILYNCIQKRGSWLSFEGEQLGQGRVKVLERMREDSELTAKINKALMAAKVDANTKGVKPVAEPDSETEKPAIKRPSSSKEDDSVDPDAIDSPEVDVTDV